MEQYEEYRKQVLDTAQSLVDKGLLLGTGGNVSLLIEGKNLIAITPSGMDYTKLSVKDICVVDFDRKIVAGELRPSIETGMHLEVYKHRPDVNAVVHTHQVYTSVMAMIDTALPPLTDEQVATLGDKVEIVPYALSGSDDLLNNIGNAVENKCNAFILQNHGALMLGTDLDKAVTAAQLLEKTATVYCHALTTGKPITTVPENMVMLAFEVLKSDQRKETRRKKKLAKKQAKQKATMQEEGSIETRVLEQTTSGKTENREEAQS